MPTHTIPSLSGTFGIPAWLAHCPKMPKEPSSSSHSKARRERQCVIEQIDDKMNQGQRSTMYKKHKWLGGLWNCGAFNQLHQPLAHDQGEYICDLTDCFESLNLHVRSGGFEPKRKFGLVHYDSFRETGKSLEITYVYCVSRCV